MVTTFAALQLTVLESLPVMAKVTVPLGTGTLAFRVAATPERSVVAFSVTADTRAIMRSQCPVTVLPTLVTTAVVVPTVP
jgi:hypothetical protein